MISANQLRKGQFGPFCGQLHQLGIWNILHSDGPSKRDAITVAAAVIPALFLLSYVYRQDRVEREPGQLLLSLVLQGIFATAIAKVLERVGLFAVDAVAREGTLLYSALLYFGVVAFAWVNEFFHTI